MKNVLILKFPYSSQYGGGERHTVLLVEQLQKLDVRFFLVSSCPVLLAEFGRRRWPTQKLWLPREPVSKIALLLFPLWAWLAFFILIGVLIRARFTQGVRTVYCLSLTEKILAAIPARLLGLRVIWAEHVGFHRWLTKNPLRYFYRLFSKFATIVVISQALQHQLVDLGVAEKNITVIYNGFDFPYFTGLRQPAAGQKPDQFVVGTMCRLEKEKGVEVLLLACQKAIEIIPYLRLIIVGEGGERKRLEWLAKNLSLDRRVQFVGFQQEPALWLRDFDVFVLPSVKRESFGASLVEALALERPVVASNLEGIPEIVKQNETGLLVQPGNSEELAQALIYLYQHPETAQSLAQRGRQYVEGQFTIERMISAFFRLFSE